MHLFFLNEVLWKLRPIFDTHHPHESQISRVALFFAASFFLPLFSYSFYLGKTDSYRKLLLSSFFGLFPLFQKWFHTMSSVFIVATSQKTDDPCELNIWESNDGEQNNEKQVQLVMSTETELLFFSTTKHIEKARYNSKSFTESRLDHHRYDNK